MFELNLQHLPLVNQLVGIEVKQIDNYKLIYQDKGIDIWTRPVEPFNNGYHSYAVAFVSRRVDGAPYPYNITLEDLGLKNPNGYSIVVSYNIFLLISSIELFLYQLLTVII